MRGACLTTDNLQRRGWQMASICHLCANDGESCSHIFHDSDHLCATIVEEWEAWKAAGLLCEIEARSPISIGIS
uniref:Reverse transcriptase zinc-binding domain-containing protein n=1 Tax=Oryza glumipatula TaxID=40148 RepID=A0A0E0BDT1_9ORYZ